ncbi:Crp/Fnr family transcriptional regulator [Cupriavidus sp. TA19]|uniref:Crp/Fnr family transcriptional regulator n=1 Tax=unclassified Cupriavidus TaxID=2640874 RepID=UPI00272944D9|nr:Crp/Fnr family transcriptional regulator [Cupriavidus sp. TA19]GLC93893.1 Crp/Fnr family transcriptional regulator [Cupriavidus sp. TA19]
MESQFSRPECNYVLAALLQEDCHPLAAQLELVKLRAGQMLSEAGQRIHHVHFPTTAVVSMLAVSESGAGIEVAVVGKEGLVGMPILTGGDSMPYRVEVRCTGLAYRIPAALMRHAFMQSAAMRRASLLYVQALLTQVAQVAVCNRHHPLSDQVCRWLLLTLERMHSRELLSTQQGIADRLGVRREGVAAAVGRMQELGLLATSRGRIVVLDRARLEAMGCECYRVIRQEYARLLPPPAGHTAAIEAAHGHQSVHADHAVTLGSCV